MVTHPDARRKGVLEQIARRAMQACGFLPDFSTDALRELEAVQQVDHVAESPGIDLRHLHGRSRQIVFLPLTFFACAQGPNSPMGNWNPMMRYGYGGGFMWLIVLVLVGVVIYFLLQVTKSKGSDSSIIETPIDILKKRYAKGEIDKEEFERKKKDLES